MDERSDTEHGEQRNHRRRPALLVFDVNETLSDMTPLRAGSRTWACPVRWRRAGSPGC